MNQGRTVIWLGSLPSWRLSYGVSTGGQYGTSNTTPSSTGFTNETASFLSTSVRVISNIAYHDIGSTNCIEIGSSYGEAPVPCPTDTETIPKQNWNQFWAAITNHLRIPPYLVDPDPSHYLRMQSRKRFSSPFCTLRSSRLRYVERSNSCLRL